MSRALESLTAQSVDLRRHHIVSVGIGGIKDAHETMRQLLEVAVLAFDFPACTLESVSDIRTPIRL